MAVGHAFFCDFLTLDRIVDGIMLGPSHFSVGLQTADLVIASALSAYRHTGDGSRWHKQLLPLFNRHPKTGEVQGAGLKVYPAKVKAEPAPSAKLF